MSYPSDLDHVRVLYVGGWGRSGSTLLDLMVGELPRFFSAGEVREIWNSGCREDRPCGCGAAFSRCPFWLAVGARAFGGWDAIDLPDVLRLRYTVDRPWRIPMLADRRSRDVTASDVVRYLRILEKLYRAIRDVSTADVVVDSSNLPSAAFLLRSSNAVDLRLVHLIRDSRGVAFSWQRTVEKETGSGRTQLPRYGLVSASFRWLGYNALTGALRRQVPNLVVRYEDFIASPKDFLVRIAALAGVHVGPDDLSYIEGRDVALGENHTVEGNPMRLRARTLMLRNDDTWKAAMPLRERAFVTLLTLPSLHRYGYHLSLRGTG
jgi:hypothetical protein